MRVSPHLPYYYQTHTKHLNTFHIPTASHTHSFTYPQLHIEDLGYLRHIKHFDHFQYLIFTNNYVTPK
jgi:hypothetical protein